MVQMLMRSRSACRLTGAATFTGIGSYALYEAYRQGAFAKVRPKGAPRGAQMTIVLGVGASISFLLSSHPLTPVGHVLYPMCDWVESS